MLKDLTLTANHMKYITLAILLIVFLFGIKNMSNPKKETVVTQSNNVSSSTTESKEVLENINE